MTPQEERAAVEAAWEHFDHWPLHDNLTIYDGENPTALIARFDGPDCVHVAFLFTQERQRQIAEVKEEIGLIEYCRDTYYWCEEEPSTIGRILAREQAALSDLTRGMKP
jgi:hypothetical protein